MSAAKLRTKLNYRPQFKGAIEGYLVNFLRRNYWKVEASMTCEDVMQEAFIVFLRVSRKYEDVTEAKHFMSLFKTAWSNQFTNLAVADSELREFPCLSQVGAEDQEEQEGVYEAAGELDCGGAVLIALEQAPSEVKEVIRLLVSAPVELLEMIHAAWRGSGKHVGTGNNLINRALGRPHGTDSINAVRNYFA